MAEHKEEEREIYEFNDSYSEIIKKPIRSQQDYLMKYIAHERLRKNYADLISKMPPKEDGSEYTPYGLVIPEVHQKARSITGDEINERDWNDSDDHNLRKLRNRIESFFQGLDIDPNLFKRKRRYQMTDELGEFFDFILDNYAGITSQIIGRHFDKVSGAVYRHIYYYYLPSSLSVAPCSEEEREQAKEKFVALMNQNGIDLYFQNNNELLDEILRVTWKKIKEVKWKPGNFEHEHDDLDWAVVCDRVYQDLYKRGLLIFKPHERLGEVSVLVSDGDIPMQQRSF